jgi:uncharacterized protein
LPSTITISNVSDQEIRIGDISYRQTIAQTTDTVIENWPHAPVADLLEADFDLLMETNPELIILGTGPTNVFPPRELVFALARRGIGLECMDTAAAARTFNVLSGE